eukprot:scaffold431_cov315-Prasinococcus_capsulatus_cf.AAC.3
MHSEQAFFYSFYEDAAVRAPTLAHAWALARHDARSQHPDVVCALAQFNIGFEVRAAPHSVRSAGDARTSAPLRSAVCPPKRWRRTCDVAPAPNGRGRLSGCCGPAGCLWATFLGWRRVLQFALALAYRLARSVAGERLLLACTLCSPAPRTPDERARPRGPASFAPWCDAGWGDVRLQAVLALHMAGAAAISLLCLQLGGSVPAQLLGRAARPRPALAAAAAGGRGTGACVAVTQDAPPCVVCARVQGARGTRRTGTWA